MSLERSQPALLPFVAAQPLVDHHCHGVLRAGGDLVGAAQRGRRGRRRRGRAAPSTRWPGWRSARWCPPLLDLPRARARWPTTGAAGRARRGERSAGGSSARAGWPALCVDTGGRARTTCCPPPRRPASPGRRRFRDRPPRAGGGVAGARGPARPVPGRLPAGAGGSGRDAGVRCAGWSGSSRSRRTGWGSPSTGGGQPTREVAAACTGRWLECGRLSRRSGGRRGWRTRCCTVLHLVRRPTSGCRSSFTSGTATGTSTCTGATRCCSRGCCGRSSPRAYR